MISPVLPLPGAATCSPSTNTIPDVLNKTKQNIRQSGVNREHDQQRICSKTKQNSKLPNKQTVITFAEGVLAQGYLAVDGAHGEGAAGALHGLRDRGAPTLYAADLVRERSGEMSERKD